MKVAVIGSRSLTVQNLGDYLPDGTAELISGGARGVDACAKRYALGHNIPYTEYLPDYAHYGKSAPLRRNLQMIRAADLVLAFWDGQSRGTGYVIRKCREMGVKCRVFLLRSA